MSDIFLSYSRDDQAIARRFAAGLEREGLSVWWDQTLHSGDAYDKVTEKALKEAEVEGAAKIAAAKRGRPRPAATIA